MEQDGRQEQGQPASQVSQAKNASNGAVDRTPRSAARKESAAARKKKKDYEPPRVKTAEDTAVDCETQTKVVMPPALIGGSQARDELDSENPDRKQDSDLMSRRLEKMLQRASSPPRQRRYESDVYRGMSDDYESYTSGTTGSDSYEGTSYETNSDTRTEYTEGTERDEYFESKTGNASRKSAKYRRKHMQQLWDKRLPYMSRSLSPSCSESTMRGFSTQDSDYNLKGAFPFIASNDGSEDGSKPKQDLAFCSIFLTVVQLLILMMQLALCGVATVDINPMIGPFPDAFSEFGGKNPYQMIVDDQWWRMVTPALLHVGALHLLANALCQLNAIAMFEREWGWIKWTFVYIMSTIGCSAFSNWFDQDNIAVGSSGSLMGMFAAKLAQVLTFSVFGVDDAIRLDQMSSILWGFTVTSLLGSLTYIDWSGNMGGMFTGFLAGVLVFSSSIEGCCWRFWWSLFGLSSLVSTIGLVMYMYIESAEPEEQLSDVCDYFRSFFPEGYECGCMW